MEIIQQWLGSTPFDGILWWGSKSQSLDLGDFVTKQQMNLLNFQTIVFVRKFFWLDFCQRWDDEKRTKDCSHTIGQRFCHLLPHLKDCHCSLYLAKNQCPPSG